MQKTTKKRKNYSREFKLNIMRELESGKSKSQIAREYDIDDSQISRWLADYRISAQDAFTRKKKKSKDAARIAELERMVGRLHVENDILKQASSIIGEKLKQLRKIKSEK